MKQENRMAARIACYMLGFLVMTMGIGAVIAAVPVGLVLKRFLRLPGRQRDRLLCPQRA